MALAQARLQVDEALAAYRRCVEEEAKEYGPSTSA